MHLLLAFDMDFALFPYKHAFLHGSVLGSMFMYRLFVLCIVAAHFLNAVHVVQIDEQVFLMFSFFFLFAFVFLKLKCVCPCRSLYTWADKWPPSKRKREKKKTTRRAYRINTHVFIRHMHTSSQIKNTQTHCIDKEELSKYISRRWKYWGVPLVHEHSMSFCMVSVYLCVHVCINTSVIEVISMLVVAAELNKAMHF